MGIIHRKDMMGPVVFLLLLPACALGQYAAISKVSMDDAPPPPGSDPRTWGTAAREKPMIAVAPEERSVGGAKDEGGCLTSAGYTHCKTTGRCHRTWEDPCPMEEAVSDKRGQMASELTASSGTLAKDTDKVAREVIT